MQELELKGRQRGVNEENFLGDWPTTQSSRFQEWPEGNLAADASISLKRVVILSTGQRLLA
jgi:hypothetical protein